MILPGSFVLTVAGTVVVFVTGIVAGLIMLGIDRKFAAHMQARVGPPIRQPFIDVAKLLCKDSVVPENAVSFIFNAAPPVAIVAAAKGIAVTAAAAVFIAPDASFPYLSLPDINIPKRFHAPLVTSP